MTNLNITNDMYERLLSATMGGIGGIISIETDIVTTPINNVILGNIQLADSITALVYGAIGAIGGLAVRELYRFIIKKYKNKYNNKGNK